MRRVLSFALVVVQILLLIGLVLVPHGLLWPLNGFVLATSFVLAVGGVALIVVGTTQLGSAFSVSPIPRKDAIPVTTGVYGVIRNPIYTGLLLAALCLVLVGNSVGHIALWLLLLVVLSVKARWEERMLANQFPDYATYGARVGRFLPGLGRMRRPLG